MGYEDDTADKDFVPEFEDLNAVGEPRLDKFKNVAMDGLRFNVTNTAVTLIVNGTLAAVGKEDEFVSQSGMRNLTKRVREESKQQYEENQRGNVCLKFDGKCSPVSRGKNKFRKQGTITVITEPSPKYCDHFEASRETGLIVASGVWDIIQSTGSVDTLLAIGAGNS